MNQVNRIISTYTADVFGAVSALFELGGMIVIHDPSGCNSTYTTHDEPRWFNSKSLLYVSGLTEMDAILGNDKKFINDVTKTALLQKPKFIALIPAQLPAMLGIDMAGIAKAVEKNTGLKTFALQTTSMRDYSVGISLALSKIAEILTTETEDKNFDKNPRGVNILGITPLDFALNGADKSITDFFERHDYPVISTFAMGSSLEDIKKARNASYNIVVSYGGLNAARIMEKAWGIPYIVGLPVGNMQKVMLNALNDQKTSVAYQKELSESKSGKKIYLIHESVIAASLATALEYEMRNKVAVINATSTEKSLIRENDILFQSESKLEERFKTADLVIADPLYKPITKNARFIALPHTAFSGRAYQKETLNLSEDFYKLVGMVRNVL